MSPQNLAAERFLNLDRIKLPNRQKDKVKIPMKVRQASFHLGNENR